MTITTTDIIGMIRDEAYEVTRDEYVKNCSVHDKFIEDLGMDSLDKIDLVNHIEDKFLIDIEQDEIEEIDTIADIAEIVQVKLEKKAGLQVGNGNELVREA